MVYLGFYIFLKHWNKISTIHNLQISQVEIEIVHIFSAKNVNQESGNLTRMKDGNSTLYVSITQPCCDFKILCRTELGWVQLSMALLQFLDLNKQTVCCYVLIKQWQRFDSAGFKLTHNLQVRLHQKTYCSLQANCCYLAFRNVPLSFFLNICCVHPMLTIPCPI